MRASAHKRGREGSRFTQGLAALLSQAGLVVRSPAKEESDRDGLASDGRAWQRWEDGAWSAALVSSEATRNVQRAIE